MTYQFGRSLILCFHRNKEVDVAIMQFDTLSYTKRLTKGGERPAVAEVHAMTMKDAFNTFADNLVTKEYLDATLDKRFSKIESSLRLLFWIQGVLVAAVLLPQLGALAS